MPAKDTKVTDIRYLEALAKAREKALEVRRKKADEKREIKMASDLEHQQKLVAAREKLGTVKPTPKADPPPKPEKKSKEPEQVGHADELESESSASSVESAPPPRPPKHAKPPPPQRSTSQPPPQQAQQRRPTREEIAEYQFRRLQQQLFGF